MTKRDRQMAEYVAERMRAARRETLGIRVHRAVTKFMRVVWLRFVGR